MLFRSAFPYFSRDIAEFWRRWHISLSTWFRDYVYIPLGGSRGGIWFKIRNTFIIFIVSGFWHGANWTFIIWGALNAIYFLPLLLANKNRNHLNTIAENKILPNIRETISVLITFSLTIFAWIFFRAENLSDAFIYIKRIITTPFFSNLNLNDSIFSYLIILSIFLIIEWIGRTKNHPLEWTNNRIPSYLRWVIYYSLIFAIITFGAFKQSQFIYFQF